MKSMRTVILGGLAMLALSAAPAAAGHGNWSIGVSFGPPACYRPCHGFAPFYYYRPYPVYVEPAPVFVRPVPVLQPVPVAQPVHYPPVQAPVAAPTTIRADRPVDVELYLRQQLADPNEQVRADAVLQLGRLKAVRAVDPLAATLAGDASPSVREAAARALGLIGSPQALPALRRAAQADSDRDVRHSARFAVEVVESNRGN